MKTLITGATGFVGSRLCQKLKMHGDSSIIGVLHRKTSPQKNLPSLDSCVTADLSSAFDLTTELSQCEAVVHLASRVHVMNDKSHDPLAEYRKANVESTKVLATQAAACGVKKFIYMSSIKVNGEYTLDHAFSPSDTPYPEDPYGVSKMEAEKVLLEIANSTKMSATILRPPLVYGPGVKANFLSLLRIVDKAIPLPFSLIKNQRSLIFVDNLCDAIITVLNSTSTANTVYTICDDKSLSTVELINILGANLNKPPRLLPFPTGFLKCLGLLTGRRHQIDRLTQSLEVDSSQFKREYNWHPPYSVEDGLKETVNWYISQCQ